MVLRSCLSALAGKHGSADLIAWIAAAPAGLVLPQVTITPLHEHGWP